MRCSRVAAEEEGGRGDRGGDGDRGIGERKGK